MLEKYKKE